MFVVFEGPDGSGKTTQTMLLRDALQKAGHAVLATREPGGTSIGEQIRTVVHAVENGSMLPLTEALLYSAARAQLVGEVIRPALAEGRFVISDRYAYSTIAYQGEGRGLDRHMLQQLTRWATQDLVPDVVVYLDLDVQEGLRRKQQALDQGGEINRMDQQTVDFYRSVRNSYLQMAREDADRWLVVEACQPVEAIHARVLSHLSELCERRRRRVQGG
ncbi:MAG: dTMP kinase [Chloroflexi bacterium]|nr:dTMP kinase [Chloroflexota bacterium]